MNTNGIYEQLVTQIVESQLDSERFYIGDRELEPAEASVWLSRFLTNILKFSLDSLPNGDDRLSNQIKLANELILWLKNLINEPDFFDDNLIHSQGKILRAIYSLENPVAANLEKYVKDIFPLTGLSQSELFCGSNSGLSLDSEIKKEILSSDKIYWLVSFIKWTGIRIFQKELEEFTNSGGKLKIITTSYMGATDAKAVEFLARLPNTEVKLSYNTQSERLHAKSYLFLRDTGFDTGYIGSSNLSHSALTSGLEWNLKITSQEIPHILKKSLSTFEAYWASEDFELFSGDARSTEKLRSALQVAGGSASEASQHFFDITPYPHQKEILEELSVQRQVHGRFRNLIVAATGTGKTLISAFDFQSFLKVNPSAHFLYIAHREEILSQARAAYRGVLKNGEFGELWVGGNTPAHYKQLFVSIQSLNSKLDQLNLTADYYDYIVIDEVHHISASSYRSALNYFGPKILLGLTATPERHDGADILSDFCGVIAAEIRLPEAINRRHLCPFQYFGIDDSTDLSSVTWRAGRYDTAQLASLYIDNRERAFKIIQSIEAIVTDSRNMKALAFCVSQEHASFMCDQFNQHGLKADLLTSQNSSNRGSIKQGLISGAINILCVVDIFNEGVDIPVVDTLLFLRPTESLTVFLQQLGRGLRLSHNKECCTVLDFVGNASDNYDFSNKFRALVGKTNQSISEEIKQGFPHAPLGCRIELTKKSQEVILDNIRRSVMSRSKIIALIMQYSHHSDLTLNLHNFLEVNPYIDPNDLYKRDCFLTLVKSALELNQSAVPTDLIGRYNKAIFNRVLTCDAQNYLEFLAELCKNGFRLKDGYSKKLAVMCHYDFRQKDGAPSEEENLAQSIAALSNSDLQSELLTVVQWQLSSIKHIQPKLENLPEVPLLVHARYAREQILVAFGATTYQSMASSREGVFSVKDLNIELLFVTLNKNEKQFSPTTMYEDYALSEHLFHAQSQNSARPDRGKGLDFIQHQSIGKRVFLFVREQSKDEYGRTLGFVNYGEVFYESHTGSQPMNMVWRLQTPIPNFMWKESAKLAMA